MLITKNAFLSDKFHVSACKASKNMYVQQKKDSSRLETTQGSSETMPLLHDKIGLFVGSV
jgi:hypothetical protein